MHGIPIWGLQKVNSSNWTGGNTKSNIPPKQWPVYYFFLLCYFLAGNLEVSTVAQTEKVPGVKKGTPILKDMQKSPIYIFSLFSPFSCGPAPRQSDSSTGMAGNSDLRESKLLGKESVFSVHQSSDPKRVGPITIAFFLCLLTYRPRTGPKHIRVW